MPHSAVPEAGAKPPDRSYLVIGPPRSASTAFARVLWNNPRIRYYSHEPFESSYFSAAVPTPALSTLIEPIDLVAVAGTKTGDGLLIKEISFQIRDDLEQLVAATSHPVVFLLRDPRLTISSRRKVKQAQQQPLDFPLAETGWADLVAQVQYCHDHAVPYLVTDSADFRAAPVAVFSRVCQAWGLDFDEAELSWQPQPELALSNHRTGGVDHFFTRVLNSRRLEPQDEVPVPVEKFPVTGGLREHVEWALAQYERLRADPSFIVTG